MNAEETTTEETQEVEIKTSKRSKKYVDSLKKFDKDKEYSLDEALEILEEISTENFDPSVESHWKMGIDIEDPQQNVRGSVSLPEGTGQETKVLVLAKSEKAQDAEDAGADYVGFDEYVEKIKDGWMDFDVVIAEPEVMSEVSELGQVLGPKGLMPSPKSGTVTQDLETAVEEFKAGKVEFRNDKTGVVHIPIGKLSFEGEDLKENFMAVVQELKNVKPSGAKENYFDTVHLATTMSPAVKVNTSSFLS